MVVTNKSCKVGDGFIFTALCVPFAFAVDASHSHIVHGALSLFLFFAKSVGSSLVVARKRKCICDTRSPHLPLNSHYLYFVRSLTINLGYLHTFLFMFICLVLNGRSRCRAQDRPIGPAWIIPTSTVPWNCMATVASCGTHLGFEKILIGLLLSQVGTNSCPTYKYLGRSNY